MRRFFIEPTQINNPVVSIEGSEAKHIKNVLRLKPGDMIRLFDGSGIEYEAVIEYLSAGRAELCIRRKLSTTAESPVQLIVSQGFLKQKKMDNLIRPLCELGMTKWMPFISERSVPQPDKKRLAARMERWEKIAKESFKQCRRSVLPTICSPVPFDEVLQYGQSCEHKIIFWEEAAPVLDRTRVTAKPHPIDRVLIVLGPEGGFSEQEIKKAKNFGFTVSRLGPRILRAETASIAACTLMQYLFGDLG
jgi:16S rRNA (uracil1498-N3)-methyltransferase